MSLKLVNRIGTLVKADAHGVVEALEDKQLLLKQTLREAELDLVQKRAKRDRLLEEEESLGHEEARMSTAIESLDRDIEMALSEGREELARFSIRKLIPEREGLSTTISLLREIAKERQELVERLTEQEREFEALKIRIRRFIAEQDRPETGIGQFAPRLVLDEEVELELLRRHGGGRDAME